MIMFETFGGVGGVFSRGHHSVDPVRRYGGFLWLQLVVQTAGSVKHVCLEFCLLISTRAILFVSASGHATRLLRQVKPDTRAEIHRGDEAIE